MNAERRRSRRRNPYPRRPEIDLARQTERYWTLTDGDGCLTADRELFVEVRR